MAAALPDGSARPHGGAQCAVRAVRRLWTIAWDPSQPVIGVECGKGLYVRTLAEESGGAGLRRALAALRRTGSGRSTSGRDRARAARALSLGERVNGCCRSDALLQTLPRVDLDPLPASSSSMVADRLRRRQRATGACVRSARTPARVASVDRGV